ncbi:MAG TPA: O-methyltransferase [Polyangiaceae bacterium]
MKARSDAVLRPEQATYLEALEPARDPLLAKMEALADERHLPISDPEVATFLAVTVAARAPRLVVELGTNIGYGSIVMARAAGPGTQVITIELASQHVQTARAFIEEAGLSDRIEVRQGAALAELEKIDLPIDLAYVDCVKEEYPQYLELLIPRLAPRGVIIADNVLWRGLVAGGGPVPETERERVDALRAFNLAIVQHPQLTGVVLPLGDGVAYATKR